MRDFKEINTHGSTYMRSCQTLNMICKCYMISQRYIKWVQIIWSEEINPKFQLHIFCRSNNSRIHDSHFNLKLPWPWFTNIPFRIRQGLLSYWYFCSFPRMRLNYLPHRIRKLNPRFSCLFARNTCFPDGSMQNKSIEGPIRPKSCFILLLLNPQLTSICYGLRSHRGKGLRGITLPEWTVNVEKARLFCLTRKVWSLPKMKQKYWKLFWLTGIMFAFRSLCALCDVRYTSGNLWRCWVNFVDYMSYERTDNREHIQKYRLSFLDPLTLTDLTDTDLLRLLYRCSTVRQMCVIIGSGVWKAMRLILANIHFCKTKNLLSAPNTGHQRWIRRRYDICKILIVFIVR